VRKEGGKEGGYQRHVDNDADDGVVNVKDENLACVGLQSGV
jgi:hypothetical protein